MKLIKIIEDMGWGFIKITLKNSDMILAKEDYLIKLLLKEVSKSSIKK